MKTTIYVGLGSNLEPRLAYLQGAVEGLQADEFDLLAVSSVYRTAPVDLPEGTPEFLNAVLAAETGLAPRAVLDRLQALETAAGRKRPSAERTLDLDLLLYDGLTLSVPGLEVPHPRLRYRAFVLVPLAEIAPDLVLPWGESARAAAERLSVSQQVVERTDFVLKW